MGVWKCVGVCVLCVCTLSVCVLSVRCVCQCVIVDVALCAVYTNMCVTSGYKSWKHHTSCSVPKDLAEIILNSNLNSKFDED